MIESNQDLRKQIFKLQAQKNLALSKNSSLIVIENQTSDNDIKSKLTSNQNIPIEPSGTSIEAIECPSEKSLQKLKDVASQKKIDPKQQSGQFTPTYSSRQIKPQLMLLKRSETIQVQKEINSPITPLDEITGENKKSLKYKNKILNLMNNGLIKKLEQSRYIPLDKAEQVKRIRGILSKDIRQRDDFDVDYLQECYKDRIFFFKTVQNRYGLTTLRKVFKVMKYLTFEKGQKIFQIGDKGDKFYIILSGKVKVAILKNKVEESDNTINEHSNNDDQDTENITKNTIADFVRQPIKSYSSSSQNQDPNQNNTPTQIKNTNQIRNSTQIKNISLNKNSKNPNSQIIQKSTSLMNSPNLTKASSFMHSPFSNKSASQSKNPNQQLITQNESQFKQKNSIINSSTNPINNKRHSLLLKISDFSTHSKGTAELRMKFTKQKSEYSKNAFKSFADNDDIEQQIKDFQEEISQKYTILRDLGVGESFGEMSMKPGINNVRTATVYASEKCELAVISRYDYMHIITPLEQQDTKEKIEFLKKIPLFTNWDKKYLKMLSYCLHEQQVSKNNYLFKEGENVTDLFIILSGEFRVTKECMSYISEIQDVEQSKVVTLKENLLICQCFMYEFVGEETLLGLQNRQFSVISNSLDSQVYRVSKYDLENIYNNLTENGQESFYNLLETLFQKREWRLDRFNELHRQFQKEKKLIRSNTLNSLRNDRSGSFSNRSRVSSIGSSPNHLRLKANSNQYNAKLTFNSQFSQESIYKKNHDETRQDGRQDSKLRSRKNTESQMRSRQNSVNSQSSIKSLHSSFSSEIELNNQILKQDLSTILLNKDTQSITTDNLKQKRIISNSINQEQNNHEQFNPGNYYEQLQQQLKKTKDTKEMQTKHNLKIDHNKMLNLDYSNTQKSSKKQKNVEIEIEKTIQKPFGNILSTPQNKNKKNLLTLANLQQINMQKKAQLTPQTNNSNQKQEKMKLNEDDEKALQDYYKLKNLPISVMFSKADEELQQSISSTTNQLQKSLQHLGIDNSQNKIDQYTSSEVLSPKYHSTNKAKSYFKDQKKRVSQIITFSPKATQNKTLILLILPQWIKQFKQQYF